METALMANLHIPLMERLLVQGQKLMLVVLVQTVQQCLFTAMALQGHLLQLVGIQQLEFLLGQQQPLGEHTPMPLLVLKLAACLFRVSRGAEQELALTSD
jgi:hypothetical protein